MSDVMHDGVLVIPVSSRWMDGMHPMVSYWDYRMQRFIAVHVKPAGIPKMGATVGLEAFVVKVAVFPTCMNLLPPRGVQRVLVSYDYHVRIMAILT